MLIQKVDCIGNLNKASALIVNSEFMEEEILDNTDSAGQKFKSWKQVIEFLKSECNSGEVFELACIAE
tara:strand:+ start:2025 stop:2228 length:204 start_codon:yes stop_codon:yes gene_type:complete